MKKQLAKMSTIAGLVLLAVAGVGHSASTTAGAKPSGGAQIAASPQEIEWP
ncbi:hypothetical protein [Streptomyces sp. NPDC058457]|uniref:hypothetical protein n=1 Tax=Streptomyces sp. NPDC058457 TaxID=3346507 RepID=UPI003664116B